MSKIVDKIVSSGLTGYIPDIYNLDFEKEFGLVCGVDLFVTYGRTWLNNNYEYIKNLFEKSKVNFRICLLEPNIKNKGFISTADFFGISVEELRSRILEVKEEYIRIFRDSGKLGYLRIFEGSYYINRVFCRLDNRIVYVLTNFTGGGKSDLRGQEKNNPAFIIEKKEEGASVFSWVMNEFESYLNQHTRCVFDSRT